MLKAVDVGRQTIASYEASAGVDAVGRLRQVAAGLRGLRLLHLNATPYGGGVAEILRSEVPLLRDLGIESDWKVITGDAAFFSATKAIHNGLQGARAGLTTEQKESWLTHSTRNAALLESSYDVVFVHDPQPLALRELHGRDHARWVWRCHIDTSEPNPEVWELLRPYLASYDAAVYTMAEFVPPDVPPVRLVVIPPAIDPESPKNIDLDGHTARRLLEWIGVETARPLMTQVSRFDQWKDPLGVVAAWRLVREQVPNLQLALVGAMALDDPEGWEIYRAVQEATRDDPDVHLFSNLNGVSNAEVNAFQKLSDVVVQKSVREGFGLVVSETLWKGTPVVAGRAGGIPLQMPEGVGGFLIDSVEECAERVLWLLRHSAEGRRLGARGRAWVHDHFLLPRLITDELRLAASLVSSCSSPSSMAEMREVDP